MAKVTDEMLDAMMDEYADAFGEAFPTIPIMWGRTNEEAAEIIRECIEKGKNVYELGYVKDGVMY